MPSGVDLLVLNSAPPESRRRIALEGVLLFEDDEVARVRWESTIRKIYLDERYRIEFRWNPHASSVVRYPVSDAGAPGQD